MRVEGVTAEQFRTTTREVVAERPTYVYAIPPTDDPEEDFCKYVHGDVPGCVIGHVAHRLGVPLAELAKREGASAPEILAEFFGLEGSVASFASEVQWRQDSGMTWADSLAHAEGYSPTKVLL
jgi:hypothetical protein